MGTGRGPRPLTSSSADLPEITRHNRPPAGTSPRKIDLNPTYIAAAALAAVTSAVLGSELGAAGTLLGAATASVLTTVCTTVYQASLQRSGERVRSLAQWTRPAFWQRSRRPATLRWATVSIGAVGVFLLAMTAITGFEWVSGEAVGGNGTGTTIEQVVNGQSGRPQPAPPTTSRRTSTPAIEAPTQTSASTGTSASTETSAPVTPPVATTTAVSPPADTHTEQNPTAASDGPAPDQQTPPMLTPRLPMPQTASPETADSPASPPGRPG